MRSLKCLYLLIVLAAALLLTGCGNMMLIDTTYHFDHAQILMPDGTVRAGRVEAWTDYEDGDQLQIRINGVTYLTHSSNVVLMSGAE